VFRTGLITAAIVLVSGCSSMAQQTSIPRSAPVTGGISPATRSRAWGVAQPSANRNLGFAAKGPAPRSLPGSLRLIAPDAPDEATRTEKTARPLGDGKRGYVELLPPPPDESEPRGTIHEAKYFELPPAPEN